jgi:hypothetical protein
MLLDTPSSLELSEPRILIIGSAKQHFTVALSGKELDRCPHDHIIRSKALMGLVRSPIFVEHATAATARHHIYSRSNDIIVKTCQNYRSKARIYDMFEEFFEENERLWW